MADTIMLEFKHYADGSRWRQTTVSRKDHREKGDETEGFYGGTRHQEAPDQRRDIHVAQILARRRPKLNILTVLPSCSSVLI
jgi:hypothetical protein